MLHDIEYKISSERYNGNIQNFGPGGVWEGEGRSFRYPVRFTNAEGGKEKYRGRVPYTKSSSDEMAYCVLGEEQYNSAHYAFGANQLYVLIGIKHAVQMLEKRFNIDFDELLKSEAKNSEKP
ncbi:hypothetical protein [Candidatus Spongiihabitans sp.]|uniref:hypothetical protein n=1 Tax=Candidatus Spongiihabitans sp. TaxID=3101308 RepID=UPI003C6F2F63